MDSASLEAGSPACGPIGGGGTTKGWSAKAVPSVPMATKAAKAQRNTTNARPGGRPSGKRTSAVITKPSATTHM